MAIRFRCSSCHAPLSIATRKAGAAIHCPRCQAEAIVPPESHPHLDGLHQKKHTAPADLAASPAEVSSLAEQSLEAPSILPVVAAVHIDEIPARGEQPADISNLSDAAPPTTHDQQPPSPRPARAAAVRRSKAPIFFAAGTLVAVLGAGMPAAWFLYFHHERRTPQLEEPSSMYGNPEIAEYFKRHGKLPEIVDGRIKGPAPNPESPKEKGPQEKPQEALVKEEPKAEEENLPSAKEFFPSVPKETEEELYRRAIQLGQEALLTENFDQAVAWFQVAVRIRPSDEALNGLSQAELGRQRWLLVGAERRKKADAQKRLDDYQRLMVKGRARLFLEEFDEALKAFRGCLDLFPQDMAARDYLAKTQQAQARYEEAERLAKLLTKEKQQQLDEVKGRQAAALFRKSMDEGKAAFAARQHRAAMGAYYEARALRPDDEDALYGWLLARKGLQEQLVEEERQEQEYYRSLLEAKRKKQAKDNLADYDHYLILGGKAMKARNYREAALFFRQALDLFPDDLEARRLRGEAEAKRVEQAAADETRERRRLADLLEQQQEAQARAQTLEQEQLKRRKQEEADRQALAFEGFLANGRLALAQGKFDVALGFFRKAGDFQPVNPVAVQLLDQAQKARQARLDAEANARKLDDLFVQAKDDAAKRKVQKDRQELQDRLTLEQKQWRNQGAQGIMLEGQAALAGGQFDLALARLQAAQQLDPDNSVMKDLLRRAQNGKAEKEKLLAVQRLKLEDDLADKNKEALRRQEMLAKAQKERDAKEEKLRQDKAYEKLVNQGIAFQTKGQFKDALQLFQQAQAQRGNDAPLQELMRRAGKGVQEQEEARSAAQKKQENIDQRWQEKQDLAKKEQAVREAAKERDKKIKETLAAGQDAVKRGKLQEALWAFAKTLELDPDNSVAQAASRKAEKDIDQQAAALRAKQAEDAERFKVQQTQNAEKRLRADYDSYMAFGRDALKKRLWDGAITSFRQALVARPGDAEAQAGLAEAQQARDLLVAQATKKIEDKERFLLQESAKESAANKAIADTLAAAQKKAKLLHEQQEQGLSKIMATVRAAVELKRFDAADAALAAARKLAPDDPAVAGLEKYVEIGKKVAVKAEADAQKQAAEAELAKLVPVTPVEQQEIRAAKVQIHVDEGQKLEKAGSIVAAGREFRNALDLNPNNQEASAGVKRIRGKLE